MLFSVARLRQFFAATIALFTLFPLAYARDEVLCESRSIVAYHVVGDVGVRRDEEVISGTGGDEDTGEWRW